MKTPHLVLTFLLAAAAMPACAASGPDDSEVGEEEIIRFPSAALANATPITYGQTLTDLTFKASDQFGAVRFNAAKGDRIEGTVSAAIGKSIVYLARKRGTSYVNVRAGGQDGARSNVVIAGIEEADDYFLVFRTMPRADSTFSVSLANVAGAPGICAGAGTLPTVAELANVTQSGVNPAFNAPRIRTNVERRECVVATGCGPVTDTLSVLLPTMTYRAIYDGKKWSTTSMLAPVTEQPKITLDAGGNVTGEVTFPKFPDAKIAVRGSIGPSCAYLQETVTKVPNGDSSYVEFRVLGSPMITEPRTPIAHPASPKPALVPTITPAADEAILARFPRGQQWLNFSPPQDLRNLGVSAGKERSCHPLTSCSGQQDIGYGRNECGRLMASGGLVIHGAKVTGPDSYALSTGWGLIPIENGVGSHDRAVVRVSETQVEFELPAGVEERNGGVVIEYSNATCTFPIAWPQAQ